MGSDARIHIWSEESLIENWPSHLDLFKILKEKHYISSYKHTLEDKNYFHIYEQSGGTDWRKIAQYHEWDTKEPMNEMQLKDFLILREFIRWLQVNSTIWEVWT